MKKIPFGILAGVCAIIIFYTSAAFIGVFYVLNGVAQQTGETVSPFASWWQILIFVIDVIAVLGFGTSLFFYVKKKKMYPELKEEAYEEEDN